MSCGDFGSFQHIVTLYLQCTLYTRARTHTHTHTRSQPSERWRMSGHGLAQLLRTHMSVQKYLSVLEDLGVGSVGDLGRIEYEGELDNL